MKRRINYRAERADRARKKAEKREARLAALSRKPEADTTTVDAPENDKPAAQNHWPGD